MHRVDPAPHLEVVFGSLHAQDVGDDAVDLDVSDESGEEEFLHDAGVEEAKRGDAQ